MRYDLGYTQQAVRELERLPPELALVVHQSLLLLAENPLALGRRVRAPIKGMFYGFKFDHEGVPWTFSATFVFSADEEEVVITHLGWMHP